MGTQQNRPNSPNINQEPPPNVEGASTPTNDHPDGKLDGNPLAIGAAPSVDKTPGPQGRANPAAAAPHGAAAAVSPAHDPKAAEQLKRAAEGQQGAPNQNEPGGVKPADIPSSNEAGKAVSEAEKTPEQKAAVIRATQLELEAQRAQTNGASMVSSAQKMSEAAAAWEAAGEKDRAGIAAKLSRQYAGQPEPSPEQQKHDDEKKVGLQDPTR